MSGSHYTQWLSDLCSTSPELRYAFIARSDGTVLGRVGGKEDLDCSGVVDVSERPESIGAFYDDSVAYEKEGEAFVPRLYAQGRTQGALAKPEDGYLLGLFTDMPIEVHKGSRDSRPPWIHTFGSRMRELVKSAPTLTQAEQGGADQPTAAVDLKSE